MVLVCRIGHLSLQSQVRNIRSNEMDIRFFTEATVFYAVKMFISVHYDWNESFPIKVGRQRKTWRNTVSSSKIRSGWSLVHYFALHDMVLISLYECDVMRQQWKRLTNECMGVYQNPFNYCRCKNVSVAWNYTGNHRLPDLCCSRWTSAEVVPESDPETKTHDAA